MKKIISFKRILKQLKDDAIGKDSHRGITLTYAWLANQFGHISLGFIPSYLVFYFSNFNAEKSAIYVSVFWLLFELYNFLGPLLSKSESKSEMVFIPKKSTYTFKPKWNNLAFDTFTDVCFFAFGAFLFSLLITQGANNTVLIIGDNKLKVENFKNSSKRAGNHLLIYGALSTGKTSLGVGILNELSIKNNSCLYVNAFKIFNYFFNDEDDVLEEHEIWNWKSADFLMIDDINPSEPIQDELISPEKLLSFIDTLKPINKINRNILKNKNIIWVLGNEQPVKINYEDSWKKMLLEIGIQEEKITTISL